MIDLSDLEDIRELGEMGMTAEIVITRSSSEPVDPSAPGYDPSTDYGDDVMGDYTPVNGSLQPIGVTTGWFVSAPVAANDTTSQDQLTTIGVHILRMPWGTDVRPRDVVVASETGDEFVVTDTNGDDTWAEWLIANVKRRE